MLRDGHLVMTYIDRENSRDRLAVSISTDEGETWKWTRHLEDQPGGRFDYPSLLQAKDGTTSRDLQLRRADDQARALQRGSGVGR